MIKSDNARKGLVVSRSSFGGDKNYSPKKDFVETFQTDLRNYKDSLCLALANSMLINSSEEVSNFRENGLLV